MMVFNIYIYGGEIFIILVINWGDDGRCLDRWLFKIQQRIWVDVLVVRVDSTNEVFFLVREGIIVSIFDKFRGERL